MRTKRDYERLKKVTSPVVITKQRTINRYKAIIAILGFITFFSVSIAILCFGTYASNAIKLLKVCNQYEDLAEEYDKLYNEYETVYEQNEQKDALIDDCRGEIQKLNSVLTEIDEQNKSLVTSNQEYYERICTYEEREELFDKYEYAIMRKDGSRTDLTYDQIKTVETLADEKGVDTDLIFSIVMTESSGKEKASNSTSTARGYGQILSGTGEFVYTKLMKAGKYDHSLALDGDTNLQMMVYYLEYLCDRNSTINGVISNYRGDDSALPSYISVMNSYLQTKHKTVSNLKK